MPRYEVIQPIEHDGKRAESGFIELSEAEAAPLLAIGHIGATRPRAARASSVQPPAVQTPVQTAAAAPEGGSESEGEGGGDGSGEGEGGEGGEGAGGSEGGA